MINGRSEKQMKYLHANKNKNVLPSGRVEMADGGPGQAMPSNRSAPGGMFPSPVGPAKVMQGQSKQTRGTQNSLAPLAPISMQKPTQPTGGITAFGANKGPMKQMNDNVTKNVSRNVQSTFNTGPNKANNLTGLSQSNGIAPANNSMQNTQNGLRTQDINTVMKKTASFFGMEADPHVGTGIDVKAMFEGQEFNSEWSRETLLAGKGGMESTKEKNKPKMEVQSFDTKGKPVEVACNDKKGKIMITGQKR